MPSTGPKSGSGGRFLRVAAGCLQRPDGTVLICQRPAHKLYPGEWEFPGGKIEPGESADQALRRELHEELGVEVDACEPLLRLRYRYPELAVELDVWRVHRWRGTVRSSEHPQLAWAAPRRLPDWKLLAANRPIVAALQLPDHYVFTPPGLATPELLAGLEALPPGALLRLRQPRLDDAAYSRLAAQLQPACTKAGLVLMLDRAPALSRDLACGWHATAAVLAAAHGRKPPWAGLGGGSGPWFAASCHNRGELEAARSAGADLLVLGPVAHTDTHPEAAPLGWAGFEALAVEAGAPVYAIGGLRPGDHPTAARHGARGVAGISAYWST